VVADVINHIEFGNDRPRSTKLRRVEFWLAAWEWLVTYNTVARLCYMWWYYGSDDTYDSVHISALAISAVHIVLLLWIWLCCC